MGTKSRSVVALIAASGLGAMLLVGLSAFWAGAESDVAALERQRQLVTSRLNDQVSRVAHDMRLMGAGYASLLTETRNAPSTSGSGGIHIASAARFGDIITPVFGYDKVFLVDAKGELALNREGDAKRYKWVRPLLVNMLSQVQDRQFAAAKTAQKTDLDLAQAALLRLEGRPSIAGIVPIAGDGATDISSRDAYLEGKHYLIAFRFMDGAALDTLSREQGLIGARFARTADAEESEVAFQIEATATREPIGFIIWTPDLPGSRVIERLTPALSLATILVAVLFVTLIVRLRRSWRQLEASEQNARHLSLHDVLTQLPNRALFASRLDEMRDAARGGQRSTVVAFIDLDRFKAVNDSYGHATGDELILAAVTRMTNLISTGDTLARVGGDEFALLLPGPAGDATSRLALCDTIIAELSRPFILCDGDVVAHIGCSIGIAILDDESQSPWEILREADVALYQAKMTGRGRAVAYEPAMEAAKLDRERLIDDLRAELDNAFRRKDEVAANGSSDLPAPALHVFYQTIHRAGHEHEMTGAEALIRWRHPERGLLTPDKFIPLAEEGGLIDLLGKFVLQEACATASGWGDRRMISVNVSPKQLKRRDFADEVLAILKETGLAPERLELEVTETALLERAVAAQVALQLLRAKGVKVALDDFGTGYSSLSHLIHFGIDRIKIDRSFVRLLDTQSNGAAIVAAIARLGGNLGIATTAEGVETEAQRDFLAAIGCSDLQGFLFSRPSPAHELPVVETPKASAERS